MEVNYPTAKAMGLLLNDSPDQAVRKDNYDIQVMTPWVDATDPRSVAYG